MWWRRKSFNAGYRAGKKQAKSEYNATLKTKIAKFNRTLKEKNREILDLKNRVSLTIAESDKSVDRMRVERDYAIAKVTKAVSDKANEAASANDRAEQLLRNTEALEVWIRLNFSKTMQAGMAFTDGLRQKLDEYRKEQRSLREMLIQIPRHVNANRLNGKEEEQKQKT